MTKITIKERLRYKFDSFMSRGTAALIGGLALVCLIFILLMGVLINVANLAPEGSDRLNLLEAVWSVLMHTIDAGAVTGATGAWSFRLFMLIVTFGGIFGVSILIGILSSGIDTKLESLRQGRSRLIEKNHIVILGWSQQVFTLIPELALANANQPDTCIVVLSEEDKVFMDETLQKVLGKLHRIRLVCRNGSPSNMTDLGIVSIQTARSIVILNPQNDQDDTKLVKTLLAITNIPRAVPEPYHIVLQVQNPKSLDVIQLIGRNQVEVVLTQELISRILVQTSRQSGLSVVYMDLLDFNGNEIYFKEEPLLEGKTYGNALLAYNNLAVIGIKHSNGKIKLNPPRDKQLQPGEQLVVISEDDRAIKGAEITHPIIDEQTIQITQRNFDSAENTLILGWSNQIYHIIGLMDQYVAPGSNITVVAEFPEAEVNLSPEFLGTKHLTVQYFQGDPTERQVLEKLKITDYNHVIVLCNSELEPDQADGKTLVTLIYLRDIATRCNHKIQIVTEILDPRNQALAQVARPDDFVLSEQIISLILAQIVQHKDLNAVFADIFDPEGSEIYLKPVTDYVRVSEPVNFYTIVEAAKQRGESAIGYRSQADANNIAKSYGVVINPKKDQPIALTNQDSIIVLAEN
ncbi:MAG: potassium transporter TrkA [Crinalium sp.]